MEIYKWDAAANGEGVDLYATLGTSAEDMPGTELGHRVEYFVGLQPGRDDVASPLAALGLFARREGETVDHGHTVPAGGPLWPGTEMRAFLILRQIGEILPALTLADGVHVEFLQAVPIFDSELRFKSSHGADALLKRWESARTPFWDPRREAEPVV
jgi:Suppressor of fused protein (SUFU)